MGATKTAGDDAVKWMSNDEPIDPNDDAWLTDPRQNQGQFYATRNNVSCLLTNIFRKYNSGWGRKVYDTEPDAKSLCERKIN